jgi:hypothetical protein
MDVERTIQFLLDNAARSDARMDRVEADLAKVVKGLDQNKTLTVQLIGLMSQQTAHHVKLVKETDRRFKEMDIRFKETNEQITRMSLAVEGMSKRIDAFLATSGRTNGHSRKGKTGGN